MASRHFCFLIIGGFSKTVTITQLAAKTRTIGDFYSCGFRMDPFVKRGYSLSSLMTHVRHPGNHSLPGFAKARYWYSLVVYQH